MKTQIKRLSSVAIISILALLMLGATVRSVSAVSTTTTTSTGTSETSEATETVDQCSTSTTTTSSTTSASTGTHSTTTETQTSEVSQTGDVGQSGDEGGVADGQTGEDEPCGDNNQVGPNEQQGDNVNVVQADQGQQNEIKNAESDQTIAGEVQVNEDSTVTSTVTDNRFTLSSSEGANGRVDIQVSGQNVNGPKAFLVSLSNAQNPTTHALLVTLDGQHVNQASSLGGVLHPSSSSPSYLVVKSGSGYSLLVSVPHFSTHQLSIQPLAFGPAQGYFSISTIELAGAAFILTVLLAVVYTGRKRIYTSIV